MTPHSAGPSERACAALRTELTNAMKRRDGDAVVAFRTTIAAIENAQAIDVQDPALARTRSPVTKAGRSEVPRRELTETQVRGIVRAQINERVHESNRYDALGHADAAHRLRAEAAVLSKTWESIGGPHTGSDTHVTGFE